MSYSDGGGSGRSSRKGSKSPKKLRVTKAENSDKIVTSVHHHHHQHRYSGGQQHQSVHKKNLLLISYYPLILLFNIIRTIIYQLYVIFKYIYASSSYFIYRKQTNKNSCQLEIIVDKESAPSSKSGEMARRPPGPGDPLFAKQKHHHRRAFEYISKALKIDEENEGKLAQQVYVNCNCSMVKR